MKFFLASLSVAFFCAVAVSAQASFNEMAISGTPVQMMKYLKEKSAVRDFQNVWRALREVSRKNGLEELWSGPEKQLRDLLVRWGDEVIPRDKTVTPVNQRNGLEAFGLIKSYVQLARAQNPDIVNLFIEESKKVPKTHLRRQNPPNVNQGKY